MSTHFQTIVIGAGSIGSATAYHLMRAGQRDVLLLEQFEIGHANGSSNDHHRIIRHSYHNETYGQLTRAMYDTWAELEAEAAQRVFVQTGGLDIAIEGTPGTDSVEGYRRVMTASGVAFETLDKAAVLERFPQWHFDGTEQVRATYQEETGFIDIRRATATHIAFARSLGATILGETPVRAIESTADGVRVITDAETFTADRVVVCTASWMDELLQPLGQTWRTTITEEQVVYIQPNDLRSFALSTFPTWVWHGENIHYGLPTYGEVAIKLARENLTRRVTQRTRSTTPHRDETEYLLKFVQDRLPAAAGPVLSAKTCPYDMPPDRNFILDALPGHPNVIVGSGAAHAGKFCALLGKILAELAMHGASSFPIDAFQADRPALVDPAHAAVFNLKG